MRFVLWVLSTAEQVFERCSGDGGRNLIVPLDEFLVAADDLVGLVWSSQRNEVVIVGVSVCSNDRNIVVDEVGSVELSSSARALGARRVRVGQNDTATWAVLAVPEGSEFCVLRALAPAETDTPVL